MISPHRHPKEGNATTTGHVRTENVQGLPSRTTNYATKAGMGFLDGAAIQDNHQNVANGDTEPRSKVLIGDTIKSTSDTPASLATPRWNQAIGVVRALREFKRAGTVAEYRRAYNNVSSGRDVAQDVKENIDECAHILRNIGCNSRTVARLTPEILVAIDEGLAGSSQDNPDVAHSFVHSELGRKYIEWTYREPNRNQAKFLVAFEKQRANEAKKKAIKQANVARTGLEQDHNHKDPAMGVAEEKETGSLDMKDRPVGDEHPYGSWLKTVSLLSISVFSMFVAFASSLWPARSGRI